VGGVIKGEPAMINWPPLRLSAFVIGTNNAPFENVYTPDNGWVGFTSHPGFLVAPLTMVSWGNGRLDLFGHGLGNNIHHRYFEGTWHEWEIWATLAEGQFSPVPPIAVSDRPGRLHVLMRASDNTILHQLYDGIWQPTDALGAEWSYDMAIAPLSPGRLLVVAHNFDGTLHSVEIGENAKSVKGASNEMQIKLENLNKILSITSQISLRDLMDILGFDRVKTLLTLADLQKAIPGIRIQGELVNIEHSDVNRFLDNLNDQFSAWESKEKTKEGKI
jgi:hypothetical protein